MLTFINQLNQLKLDIVGIVAVLGEGCTSRTLQVSALSWPHVFPRLLPAPQALLRHEQEGRLPVWDGIVIGAYSGNIKHELNFFTQLLHRDPPEQNTVELLEVTQNGETPVNGAQAFGVRRYSWLTCLSVLGCAMAFAMIGMSIHYGDGFSLVAVVALAATSSIVGVASWWSLEFEEEKPLAERKGDIPHSDVIIYYPMGSFRIVRCTEEIARLYFKREKCRQFAGDDIYRIAALLSSVLLMGGLLCMGNAETVMQVTFAAAYISLNVLHWAVSALNPMHYHWAHNYKIEPIKFNRPKKRSAQTDDTTTKNTKTNGSKLNEVRRSDTATSTSMAMPSSPTGVGPSIARFNSAPQPNTASRQNGLTFDIPQSPTTDKISPFRRKGTDIEAFKKRPAPHPRSWSASFKTFARQNSMLHSSTPDPTQTDEDRRFTAALWQVIALTGTSRWLRNTHIAPNTDVWEKWIELAGQRAKSKVPIRKDSKGNIVPSSNQKGQLLISATTREEKSKAIDLPLWDYQGALNRLLKEEREMVKERPPSPEPLPTIDDLEKLLADKMTEKVKERLKQLAQEARDRAKKRRVIHAFRTMSRPVNLNPNPTRNRNGGVDEKEKVNTKTETKKDGSVEMTSTSTSKMARVVEEKQAAASTDDKDGSASSSDSS